MTFLILKEDTMSEVNKIEIPESWKEMTVEEFMEEFKKTCPGQVPPPEGRGL